MYQFNTQIFLRDIQSESKILDSDSRISLNEFLALAKNNDLYYDVDVSLTSEINKSKQYRNLYYIEIDFGIIYFFLVFATSFRIR